MAYAHAMKISMMITYSDDPRVAVEHAQAMERAGVDQAWVAEAYSFDAVSTLGFLAASTETMELVSGILPIYSRTPTLTAMTAATLDSLSGGRFSLGLGASGPQVIEGWHGVPTTVHSVVPAKSSRCAARSGSVSASNMRGATTRCPTRAKAPPGSVSRSS